MAERADCTRRKVGAVIVRDNHVIAVGYNGAAPGELGCLEGGCPRGRMSYEEIPAHGDYSNCIAYHAEENAILDCAKRGVSCVGTTMYVTDKPCYRCGRMISQAGIVNVDWQRE